MVEVEERDGVGNLSGWGFGDVVLSNGAQLDERLRRWVPVPLPLISPFIPRTTLPSSLTPLLPSSPALSLPSLSRCMRAFAWRTSTHV